MFNTYTLGENARHSPGLVLLMHMVAECADRGLRSFDIGVGRAHYKSSFCQEPEPLFDTFLPLTLRGRLAAGAFSTAFAAKRMIKQNPALWSAVQASCGAFARVGSCPPIPIDDTDHAAAFAPVAPISAGGALTSTLTLTKPALSSCSRASAVSGSVELGRHQHRARRQHREPLERGLPRRAGVEHDVIIAASERLDRDR